jgi:PAS domain S-box-containing protein
MSNLAFRPQDLGIGHLFERVRDAVIVADAHTGRIVLWNSAATEIFGYSVSEALEMNVEELVPERLKVQHRGGLARYRETGHGRYIDSRELLELPAVRKTGEAIRIEMSLSPIEPTRDVGDEDRRYALAIVRDITERKRTEEALRESEARFAALVQNALDIVMVTDAEGTIRYISPSVERVLGYRSEEMVGTSIAKYVHADDLERALEELAKAASKPGVHPVAVETRVRHKDDSWRHLEGIANNLLGDPAVGGMVFNHRDVTDRKRAEEEVRRLNEELENRVKERTARLETALADLRASEERYRLLVDSVEDYAIFMVDPNGRVLDWNVGAQRTFGYREEEIVGKESSLLFTPEDRGRSAYEEELRKAVAEGRAENERWHIRKDGTRFWASGVMTPVRDQTGNMRGFAKVARDVTDRKEAEKRLREAETRYRTLVEQIPAITYVQEPIESSNPKAVTYMSPQYETMLGYPSDSEVIDEEHWLRTLHPEDRERVLAEEARTDESGEPFEVEYRVIARDGRVVWVRDQAALVRDEEGHPLYWLGVQYDITERKRAEEALRQVREAERSRMGRDLHDGVMQDLSYTATAMEIIKLKAQGTGLEDELQTAIDAARGAVQGLRAAVNDLRLGEEQDRPLPELVESLVQRNRAMARGCEIRLGLGEWVPSAPLGNAGTEVLRVMQEALTNARRHSGARNVRVVLRMEGENLVAEVSDDGQGFEPRTAPGGVGLKSMRERAAALGGKLEIESKPGEGTTVYLRMPVPQKG